MIKPKPLCPTVPGGFTVDNFTIDEPAGVVSCPAGHTWPMSPRRTVTFGRLCADCPRWIYLRAKAARSMLDAYSTLSRRLWSAVAACRSSDACSKVWPAVVRTSRNARVG